MVTILAVASWIVIALSPLRSIIREKLQEQIFYLQNEIRKRDEMLELSDYEDITSNDEEGEDELIEDVDDEEDELDLDIYAVVGLELKIFII